MPDDVAASGLTPADVGLPLPAAGLLVLDVGPVARAVLAHDESGVSVLRAQVEGPGELDLLLAAARSVAGPDGVVRFQLPGAHQGLDLAVASGARVVDTDVWCATPGAIDLWDPRGVLPSPCFG